MEGLRKKIVPRGAGIEVHISTSFNEQSPKLVGFLELQGKRTHCELLV